MLSARLLGGLVVSINGRRVPDVPGLKPRSLLGYLLLNPGPHPRSRLAGRFWPDVLDTSARASLRSALWTIRATLERAGGGAWMEGDRAAAGLSAELPRRIDVEEVSSLLAAGDPASLERAVTLGDAPLLPDLVDEWALEAQDAHRDRMVDALEALAAHAESTGDHAAAVAWTRRALRLDRLREATHRGLMRRLAAAGERPRPSTPTAGAGISSRASWASRPRPRPAPWPPRSRRASRPAALRPRGPLESVRPSPPGSRLPPSRWRGAGRSWPPSPRPGRARGPAEAGWW